MLICVTFFVFLLVSRVGCDFCLWLFLDFSVYLFDLEKLKGPTLRSALQATLGSRFAPLATLEDENADLHSMVAHFYKAVTDTTAGLLGNRTTSKEETWVTTEILDLCDQRRIV